MNTQPKHTPEAMAVRSASLRNLAVNQTCNEDILHDAADMLYDGSRELEKLRSDKANLLEACQTLLQAEGAMFGTEYSNELLLLATDFARAALNKATGGK